MSIPIFLMRMLEPRGSQGTNLYYEMPQTRETAREGPASTGTWGEITPEDAPEELKGGN